MRFTVEHNGKRYTVEFFRSYHFSNDGKPSRVSVLREKTQKSMSCAPFVWVKRWDVFSKKDPNPELQTVIKLAVDMREQKLAYDPRFPCMR